MKYCPNCGSVRNDKDVCECGYSYLTGEIIENSFMGMGEINKYAKVEMNQGVISLEELKKRKLDLGDLIKVSYTSSGGMMGSYYNDELSFETNELTVIDQKWHHGEKKKIVYKANEKEVQEIKNILIDNNFSAWSEISVDNSLIAFDAPSSSMSLTFQKKSVSISTMIYMDQQERDLFFKVREKINSFMKNQTKISEKILTQGEELGMMGMFSNISSFCPKCGKQLQDEKCECGYEKKIN